MTDHPPDPSGSEPYPLSDPDAVDPNRSGYFKVGGPWYEIVVDGEVVGERVRGEDAASIAYVAAAGFDPDPDVAADISTVDAERFLLVFSGPAMSYTLPVDADPDSVTASHADRGDVSVTIDGRTVVRPDGHFGRGRWTVTYRPA